MSDTQIPALEHTIQQTNVWLKKLAEELHLDDKRHAYVVLRAVLHVLRDRLTPEQAVHFGAQLPILVRGVYYEGWRPAKTPMDERQPDEFAALVAALLPDGFAREALRATKAVFHLLGKELDPGETAKVVATLPAPLRFLWPARESAESH